MKSVKILFMTGIFCSIFSLKAFAGPESGFSSMFNMFFGTEQERTKSKDCSGADSATGMLGQINGFLCHMEKDMGITGVGSMTKTFSPGAGDRPRSLAIGEMNPLAVTVPSSISIHCEISNNAAGATYDKTASCWICTSGACSAAASFNRFITLQWSFSGGSTPDTNKGQMLTNPTAFGGGDLSSNGINITYDVGALSTSKSIIAKMIFSQGGTSFKMRADATKSSTNAALANGDILYAADSSGEFLKATIVSTQFRFDVGIKTGTNRAELVSFEGGAANISCSNGFLGLQANATGDTPTCSQCMSGTSNAAGDFDHTADTTGTLCSGLTLKAYPSDSATAVGAYTLDTAATSIMGTNGNWNGMTAAPSSI